MPWELEKYTKIEVFCCRNPECSDFGVRAKSNLRWHVLDRQSHQANATAKHTPGTHPYLESGYQIFAWSVGSQLLGLGVWWSPCRDATGITNLS